MQHIPKSKGELHTSTSVNSVGEMIWAGVSGRPLSAQDATSARKGNKNEYWREDGARHARGCDLTIETYMHIPLVYLGGSRASAVTTVGPCSH